MRIRNLLIAIAVLSLAIPGFANAGSAYGRATGGGQILVSTDGGAGDTIAFTARNTATSGDAARGQVQLVDRTGGSGQGNLRFHGTVTCLRVSGTIAKIGGVVKTDSTGDTSGFTMVVQDNGEGVSATDADQIAFERVSTPDCDDDGSDDDTQTDLARGNVQVYAP